MPSSATTRNRLELQAAGENNNSWGTKANNVFSMVDAALDGMVSFSLSGSKTLTATDYTDSEANKRYLNVTGGTGGTITIPNVEKWYLVRNNSSGDVIVTTGSGTTATVPEGSMAFVVCEGSNVVRLVDVGAEFTDFGRTLVACADAAAALLELGAAALDSPTFTGTPAGPTASAGTATTQLATTAFTDRMRNVPPISKTTSFTLSTTERGAHVKYTGSAGTATINPNSTTALGDGFVTTIINQGTGALTITRGAGVTLRWAGSGSASTNANRTLAIGGLATILKLDTDEYVVSGVGLS